MPQQWFLYLTGYWIAVNLVLFFLMAIDKRRARRGKWRVSEATLFVLALAGGSLGGLLGMKRFRHKTKKAAFTVGFTGIFILQLSVLIWLWIKG